MPLLLPGCTKAMRSLRICSSYPENDCLRDVGALGYLAASTVTTTPELAVRSRAPSPTAPALTRSASE